MDTEISALLDWASRGGAILNGIAPKRLAGRGIGIICTRKIRVSICSLTVDEKMELTPW